MEQETRLEELKERLRIDGLNIDDTLKDREEEQISRRVIELNKCIEMAKVEAMGGRNVLQSHTP